MKKENIYKLLYLMAILLLIGFGVRLWWDYFTYDPAFNSAPFYVFAIRRGVEFILPGLIMFLGGVFCKRRYNK